jgi:T5orf172 domain
VGAGIVYAYGYRCCEDRLKVGFTEGNTVQRIAAQIGTSTPDKPVLLIEIKTDQCRALERAILATLETRGRKIPGGGAEWFKASRDEILAIYQFITQSGDTSQGGFRLLGRLSALRAAFGRHGGQFTIPK